MYLSVNIHPEAMDYIVINKDTGEKIDNVFEADDETGFYRYYKDDIEPVDSNHYDFREFNTRTTRGNIKLIKEKYLPLKEETSFGKKKDSFSNPDKDSFSNPDKDSFSDLDIAAKHNLSKPDLDDYHKYKQKLISDQTPHEDICQILIGFIWNIIEFY